MAATLTATGAGGGAMRAVIESSMEPPRPDPIRRIVWAGTLTSIVVAFLCIFMEADVRFTWIATFFVGMAAGVGGGLLGKARDRLDNLLGVLAILAIALMAFAMWSGLCVANDVKFRLIREGMPLSQVESILGPPEWKWNPNTPRFKAVLTKEQSQADYRFANYPLRVLTTFPTVGLPVDVRRWSSDDSVIVVRLDEHDCVTHEEYIAVHPSRNPRWKVWLRWLTGTGAEAG